MYFVPVGVGATVVEWIALWSHDLEVASLKNLNLLRVRCSGVYISVYFVPVGVNAAMVEWITHDIDVARSNPNTGEKKPNRSMYFVPVGAVVKWIAPYSSYFEDTRSNPT